MIQSPVVAPQFVKKGYAAIISILVLIPIIIVIGLTTSRLGIGNAQMSLGDSKSTEVITLIESCINDALLSYNEQGSLPITISTPQGTCTLTINTTTSSGLTFTTIATISGYTHDIQVTAERGANVTVVNWTQIN